MSNILDPEYTKIDFFYVFTLIFGDNFLVFKFCKLFAMKVEEKNECRFLQKIQSLWGKKIFEYTVKPVLRGHSKIDKTKILMTNGSLLNIESIAEYSHWSILQCF